VEATVGVRDGFVFDLALLIVLLVIVLVFGTSKLKNVGKARRRDQGFQGRHS
jgi:hypothetical protein